MFFRLQKKGKKNMEIVPLKTKILKKSDEINIKARFC